MPEPPNQIMQKNLLKSILVILFLLNAKAGVVWAQVEGISIVSAENYYLDKDYRNALIGFEEYLFEIQFDKEIAYKAGICAARLGMGKRGVNHILSARKAGKSDNYMPYWIGRSYHLDEKWDSASKYLEQYLEVFPIDKSFKKDAERFLSQIEVAKTMISATLQPFIIENMGNGINSVYSEFHPILTADGKMMVYTSRKRGYTEEKLLDDGEYKEKIFSSRLLPDGSWSKGVPIRLVEGRNKDLDFNLVQFLDNDTKLLLYKMGDDGAKLYVSEYQNESWKLPYLLPIEPDPRFFTGDIVFSEDLKTVVFTNNGNTNKFQNDLYTSKYDDKTEKWTDPVYLGKNINSPQDEGAPFFPDSKTMIFSSKSLGGLGDFDLYTSTWDEATKSWGKPVNMGFPYNTPNNDFYLYMQAGKPDVKYFSSVRGTTKGLSDIYKVTKTGIVKGGGTIKDETGKPVASTVVMFDDPENYQNIMVKTDASGNFMADLVEGQTYLIHYKNSDGFQLESSIRIPFPCRPGSISALAIQLLPKEALKKKVEINEGTGD